MPSVWSWLTKQKFRSDESSKSSKKGSKKYPEPSKEHFGFYHQDKQYDYFAEAPPVHARSYSFDQPVHANEPSRPKTVEEEKQEYLRNLHEFVNQNNISSSRRPLAFEIFEDAKYKPAERQNGRPAFLSQPNLNESSPSSHENRNHYQGQRDKPRDRDDKFIGLERNAKSPSAFGAMATREQRQNRLQARPSQNDRRGTNIRRTESMYAYTPRATIEHDASDLLFGREKEQQMSSWHAHPVMQHFAGSPVAKTSISEDPFEDEDLDVLPTPQSSALPRQRSESSVPSVNRNSNFSTDGPAYPAAEAIRRTSMDRPNKPPSKIANYRKSSSGNDNFFFTSSMLVPDTDLADLSAANDKPGRKDSRLATGEKSKKKQKISEDETGKPTRNLFDAVNDKLNNKDNAKRRKDRSDSQNGIYRPPTDHSSANHNNNNNISGGEDNDFFTQSRLNKPDRRRSTASNDAEQLENIFSSVGEVLY